MNIPFGFIVFSQFSGSLKYIVGSSKIAETIQQLKEKITGLETDNANLQARLTDCLQEQTLGTSSSSQELQTLEEGLGNQDQRHSSNKTRRYGFVETRRGSILENTVGK